MPAHRIRPLLLLATLGLLSLHVGGPGARVAAVTPAARPQATIGVPNTPTFHGDAARTGWNPNEDILTPANVSGGGFGPVWNSPPLDSVVHGGVTIEPHLYASPLYIDRVAITAPPFAGSSFGVVFAATSTGFVYAIKALDSGAPSSVPAGTILWRRSLGTPSVAVDGGVTLGVLGTPTIDLNSSPPRMYVASDVTDATGRSWQLFALDLGSGSVLSGWPLAINSADVEPVDQNPPASFAGPAALSQRGGLNLSADGHYLYVPFGAYGDGATGFMVTVDTRTHTVVSAFAGGTTGAPNGGMWGSGGVAVDAGGTILETTGNSPLNAGPHPGVWGNSLLEWNQAAPLRLSATYSPWNYCAMDVNDTDLGGGSPIVFDLDPATTSTPHLAAFGGKQGNAYLVDRTNLVGGLVQRPPCRTDSSTDTSLLPPGNQPQFGRPGPLNIFGPYSETSNNTNFAKARSEPAYFKGPDGSSQLIFTGSTKRAVGDITPVSPSVVRTRVVTSPGRPAYLSVAALDTMLAFKTPGTPIVTSNGTRNPIVWVTDANVFRSDSLRGPSVPHPILYALDAMTLRVLWSSTPSQLDVGGKYSQPTVAHGTVFVGTDRIQAFGLVAQPPAPTPSAKPSPTPAPTPGVTTVDDSVQGTGLDQLEYVGGWFHCTAGCIAGSYDNTLSYTDTANDTVTISFIGTRIKFYTSERDQRGIGAVSVDGGPETLIDQYSAGRIGDVLVYTSPVLRSGTHTFRLRSTGMKDPASLGPRVCIDRVDVIA